MSRDTVVSPGPPRPAPTLEQLAQDVPWGLDGYQYRWLDALCVHLWAMEQRLGALEDLAAGLQKRV